jgi:predicted secreted protein
MARRRVRTFEEVQMMKRLPKSVWCVAALTVVALGGLVVSSSAPAGKVDVRVGGFAFEPGSSVALELVPADGAACFDASLWVEQVELTNANGHLISIAFYEPQVDAAEWIGTVILRAADGSNLAVGAYEIRVTTNAGTFITGLDVVLPARFADLGRFVAGVPVCNASLRVYRLITELDGGARATLRQGDRLMVLLAGNPTTGYSWLDTLAYEYAAVRATEDVEFRPDSTSLLGAGGFFFFRYLALDVGFQEFRFGYQRPWESVEPISTLTFSVDVR